MPIVHAQDISVQTLSEGACWYEQGETLKIVSFNEKESILTTRDEIEDEVQNLLSTKKIKAITSDLSLHCGGYGASLVVKSKNETRPLCLWLKMNNGKLEIRSLGGLENSKSEICDGYKWGELIAGLKSLDQKAVLESEAFHDVIKSVTLVSGSTIKITLHESFFGREMEVISELKKQISLRYIELNLYQHPVGEVSSLK